MKNKIKNKRWWYREMTESGIDFENRDSIILLSGVSLLFLILNSKIFVHNICDKGYVPCIFYIVMKYYAPLMMFCLLIAAIYGAIKIWRSYDRQNS